MITVTQPAAGGEITVFVDTAKAGDTVTVTAIPDNDYQLKNIIVNGQAIAGNTFIMPDANVEVTAEFEKKAVENTQRENNVNTGIHRGILLSCVLLLASTGGAAMFGMHSRRRKAELSDGLSEKI